MSVKSFNQLIVRICKGSYKRNCFPSNFVLSTISAALSRACATLHIYKGTRRHRQTAPANVFQAPRGARLSSWEITPRYRKYEPFDRPCRIESPLPSPERNPTRYTHLCAYISAVCIHVCARGVCGLTYIRTAHNTHTYHTYTRIQTQTQTSAHTYARAPAHKCARIGHI